MKNKNILKINIIYFIAICSVAIVFLLSYIGILENDILSSILIQVVVMFALPLLLYSILMKKSFKQTFKDCGFKSISGKMILISITLGFVLYFLNSFIADVFYGIITLFGYENLHSTATTTLNYQILLKEFVLSCILPGICEEFLHRGIMLNANKKYNNPRFCLIISSILFGFAHLNIRQFFYATILGYLMGLLSLASNSIYPCMIVHFMNNFLSNYFFYGTYMNWPLAKFINYATNVFSSNALLFVTACVFFISLLLVAYNSLLKLTIKEQAKQELRTVMKELSSNNISLIQAQIQINHVNNILTKKHLVENKKVKFNFLDNVFLISSIILGTIITISSFIWGVI